MQLKLIAQADNVAFTFTGNVYKKNWCSYAISHHSLVHVQITQDANSIHNQSRLFNIYISTSHENY